MIRRQASLGLLMGLVATVAVGLAAMKVATEGTSRALSGLGLLALLVGTLGALVGRRGRAAWVGFALFGWAYALALLVPELREAIAAELPGEGPLEEVVALVHPPLSEPAQPAFYLPSSAVVEPREVGGFRYTAPGGQVVVLAAREAKQWEAYLGRQAAYQARVESSRQARRIALTFLGLAFAFAGAAAGHALGGPAAESAAPPGAESPASPD